MPLAMSRRSFLLAGTCAVILPATARAQVDPNAAARFIATLAEQAIAVLRTPGITLEQREARFRQLLRDGFDLDFIGRFVLGRHYHNLSPDQAVEYRQLFGEFVLKTYSRRLGGYAGQNFNVIGTRAAGERDVMVRTRIDQPSGGPPIDCEWRVRATGGQYRIIDVMVEGVSMALTQRQEFASVVAGSGTQGLLAALRAKTERLPATASR